jgi:hypothetical protein
LGQPPGCGKEKEMTKTWLLTDEQYNRLNPPPVSLVAGDDGKPYAEIIDNPNWMWMGYIPTPKSRTGWFFHHIMHGLMMRYPFFKVLLYAISHTTGEADAFKVEVTNKAIDAQIREVARLIEDMRA